MKKKFTIIICCILIIFLLGSLLVWYNRPERIFIKNQEVLEGVVEEYFQTGIMSVPNIKGVVTFNLWENDHRILEFITKGFGVAPASTYKGFYYSVDGIPVAFQGINETLILEVDNWWHWKGEGDNGGRTKCITGNWYVFEAHF